MKNLINRTMMAEKKLWTILICACLSLTTYAQMFAPGELLPSTLMGVSLGDTEDEALSKLNQQGMEWFWHEDYSNLLFATYEGDKWHEDMGENFDCVKIIFDKRTKKISEIEAWNSKNLDGIRQAKNICEYIEDSYSVREDTEAERLMMKYSSLFAKVFVDATGAKVIVDVPSDKEGYAKLIVAAGQKK